MISKEIDKFIEENGGNTRDALNVALARLWLAEHTYGEVPPMREDLAAMANMNKVPIMQLDPLIRGRQRYARLGDVDSVEYINASIRKLLLL